MNTRTQNFLYNYETFNHLGISKMNDVYHDNRYIHL